MASQLGPSADLSGKWGQRGDKTSHLVHLLGLEDFLFARKGRRIEIVWGRFQSKLSDRKKSDVKLNAITGRKKSMFHPHFKICL